MHPAFLAAIGTLELERPGLTTFLLAVDAALGQTADVRDRALRDRVPGDLVRDAESIVAAMVESDGVPHWFTTSVAVLAEGLYAGWVRRGRPDPSYLEIQAAQLLGERWWGAVGR